MTPLFVFDTCAIKSLIQIPGPRKHDKDQAVAMPIIRVSDLGLHTGDQTTVRKTSNIEGLAFVCLFLGSVLGAGISICVIGVCCFQKNKLGVLPGRVL
jgi:hypothetical protein